VVEFTEGIECSVVVVVVGGLGVATAAFRVVVGKLGVSSEEADLV